MNNFLAALKAFSIRYKWELTCLFLATIVLFGFFGKLIFDANSVYFEPDGDGLQTYYNSLYHLKYDSTFFNEGNMNYPYGENVMFTASQPFILAPLDALGLEDYTVGTMNLLMLFSIPVSALFIYLNFRELGYKGLLPVLLAICIAFLSPQVSRLRSHYTLTYQFAIPAFFWLLLRFDKRSTYKTSFIIALLVFLLSSIHLYFFAFFVLIAPFYYLYVLVQKKEGTFLKTLLFSIKHFFIQLIAPYLLLQMIVLLTNSVYDRTNNPSGFETYTSNWIGVFFPYNSDYELFFKLHIYNPTDGERCGWEGFSYVGLFGIISSLLFVLSFVWNLVRLKFRSLLRFVESKPLNYFIIGSIFLLLFSFGYPFVLGHMDWLEYIGPLKQLRACARFAWVFFYIINIAGGVFILSKVTKPVLRYCFLSIAILFTGFDAFEHIYKYQDMLYGRIPELEDKSNQSTNFFWLQNFKPANYQAIIPLPYFHIGSENLGILPRGEIKYWSYITSIKTGLPLLASSYSRTSMSQTVENIQIVQEPNLIPKWFKDLPNNKPFLVMTDASVPLSNNEINLVKKATPLFKNQKFGVYELRLDSLKSLYTSQYALAVSELDRLKEKGALTDFDGYLYTGKDRDFVVRTFDKEAGKGFYNGNGNFGKGQGYNILFEDTIPNATLDTTYSVSVWINKINVDLFPRIFFIIDISDSNRVWKKTCTYEGVAYHIARTEGNWALIEVPIQLENPKDIVKVCSFNQAIPVTDSVFFDELLIIPSNQSLFKNMQEGLLYKNNRFVHQIKEK